MQQSRLASPALNSLKTLSVARMLFRQRPLASASTTSGRTGEPEVFYKERTSPLSEMKVVNTRKPVTRAGGSGSSRDVVGWLPEQLDTAEEALERARRIWRQNAMRGDPDTPHGRVLRALRGEWF